MHALRLWFFLSMCSIQMGCMRWPGSATDVGPPDEVLWTRATQAIEQRRCDVSRITLQTLINTYPNSEYSHSAENILQSDPRLTPCGHDVGTSGSRTWYVGGPDNSD